MRKKRTVWTRGWTLALLVVLGAPAAAQTSVELSGPAVAVASPRAGEVLGGVIQIEAAASAAAAVQFEVDGAPISAPLTAAPYMTSWDTSRTADGGHVLTAVAIDRAGARAVSPLVRVTVLNHGAKERGRP